MGIASGIFVLRCECRLSLHEYICTSSSVWYEARVEYLYKDTPFDSFYSSLHSSRGSRPQKVECERCIVTITRSILSHENCLAGRQGTSKEAFMNGHGDGVQDLDDKDHVSTLRTQAPYRSGSLAQPLLFSTRLQKQVQLKFKVHIYDGYHRHTSIF
jgi:hypothetical protein